MLADAVAQNSGAKAAACGRLASLSAVSEKGNICGVRIASFFFFSLKENP